MTLVSNVHMTIPSFQRSFKSRINNPPSLLQVIFVAHSSHFGHMWRWRLALTDMVPSRPYPLTLLFWYVLHPPQSTSRFPLKRRDLEWTFWAWSTSPWALRLYLFNEVLGSRQKLHHELNSLLKEEGGKCRTSGCGLFNPTLGLQHAYSFPCLHFGTKFTLSIQVYTFDPSLHFHIISRIIPFTHKLSYDPSFHLSLHLLVRGSLDSWRWRV